MKKSLFVLVLACILFACEKKLAEPTVAETETVALPVEFTYKGKPAVGDPKNVLTVIQCNKRLSELNTDIGEFLADTVTWNLADGTSVTAPRDSMISALNGFIRALSSMKIVYVSAIAVDNEVAGHEWVFSWTEETYTYKDGKVESQDLHEDYRIEGGKIREIHQYARKAMAETAIK
jgi:hypothetical protein